MLFSRICDKPVLKPGKLKERAPIILVLLFPVLQLSACSDNSDSGDLKASVSAINHMDSTSNIHLDLNNVELDNHDEVSHTITVTDVETGETVFELDSASVDEIQNLRTSFSPLPDDLPHWEPHNIQRTLAIDYTLQHTDGRSDHVREYISINEHLALGDISKAPPQPLARNSSGVSGPVSDDANCKAHCYLRDKGFLACYMPTVQNCISVNFDSLIKVANDAIGTSQDYSEVTEDTSMWLQAAGGYGGNKQKSNGTYNSSGRKNGGYSGFSHTVTTIKDLKATLPDGGESIYYYIAQTGAHSKTYGTGGPSTIVTKKQVAAPMDLDHIILIAGGGGGAASNGGGGSGGLAVADATTINRTYAIGVGMKHDGGSGGGQSGTQAKGGDGHGGDDGNDGYGGDAGRSPRGWLNANIGEFLEGQGKGGGGNEGRTSGGGGGFGGGGAGGTRGGGGGGSFAMAATMLDSSSPASLANDLLDGFRVPPTPAPLTSSGWFRIIFNTDVRKAE